jgi:hypothetical protein
MYQPSFATSLAVGQDGACSNFGKTEEVQRVRVMLLDYERTHDLFYV